MSSAFRLVKQRIPLQENKKTTRKSPFISACLHREKHCRVLQLFTSVKTEILLLTAGTCLADADVRASLCLAATALLQSTYSSISLNSLQHIRIVGELW